MHNYWSFSEWGSNKTNKKENFCTEFVLNVSYNTVVNEQWTCCDVYWQVINFFAEYEHNYSASSLQLEHMRTSVGCKSNSAAPNLIFWVVSEKQTDLIRDYLLIKLLAWRISHKIKKHPTGQSNLTRVLYFYSSRNRMPLTLEHNDFILFFEFQIGTKKITYFHNLEFQKHPEGKKHRTTQFAW